MVRRIGEEIAQADAIDLAESGEGRKSGNHVICFELRQKRRGEASLTSKTKSVSRFSERRVFSLRPIEYLCRVFSLAGLLLIRAEDYGISASGQTNRFRRR